MSQINRKLHLLARRYGVGSSVTHRDGRCCKTDKRGLFVAHHSHFHMHKSEFVYLCLCTLCFYDLYPHFLESHRLPEACGSSTSEAVSARL